MRLICQMTSKEFKTTVERFKELYPELVQYGNSYEECGNMAIIVRIPNKGKVRYEYLDDEITWLEHWTNNKEKKQRENELRPKTYGYFCFVIEQYMENHQMTQQQFADLVGISRRSLIKYLQGQSIPKVNTMRRICKTINIDI